MPTLHDVIWERDLVPYLHVSLLGVDITDDLLSEDRQGIEGIELTLDYPELNVFKTSNIILTLSNADGRFSPDNPTNFFITHGDPNVVNALKADGFGAKVTVDIGKIVNGAKISRRIFIGKVIDLELMAKPAQVKITCVDGQQALRETVLQDFGIDRWLKTIPVENALPWGTYRVPDFMTPISEESVSVTKAGGDALINVEQIRTEGRIREDACDIKYIRGEVRTEGGELGSPPHIKFREPWRWRFLDGLVREILNHTGTKVGTIDIPKYRTEERLMSTHGRVGWATEFRQAGRTAAAAAGWSGYGKDFVFNSDGTEAVFIYGGKGSQHALLHYNLATDTWTGLYEPAKPIELWQIATTDFDDFYVLGSSTGSYDALDGGSIKIWRFRMSTGAWSVVSQSGSGDPQLGSAYHFDDLPIRVRPDTHRLFDGNSSGVFFRKASTSKLGVRSVANDYNLDYATPGIDGLNYAYDGFITNSYIYLVYVVGTTTQTLKVVRQPINNPSAAATTVLSVQLSSDYFYYSVSNCVADGDAGFWCILHRGLLERGRDEVVPGKLGHGSTYPGHGLLTYINLTNTSLRTLYANRATNGATGGVRISAGNAIFFIGTIYLIPYSYRDLTPPEVTDPGHLLEVTKTDAVINQRSWTSIFPDEASLLNRCISPFRQARTSTFFIAGFDVPDNALGYDTESPKNAQSPENWQLFELAADVPLKLPRLNTHNTRAWDVLTDLAILTRTAIGFENDAFTMRQRDAVRTRLTNEMARNIGTISVEDTSEFPSSGHLLVRQEVLTYSAKTDTTFTIDARGVHDSDIDAHDAESEVMLVHGFAFDHAIDSNLISVNLEPDFLNLYNQITVRYGEDNRAYAEDADSVKVFGERPYQLTLPNLSEHQRDWAKRLVESYLEETSHIRSLISMRLRWSPELETGQIIVLHHEDTIHLDWVPCRILRIYHDVPAWETHITAKEIPRRDLQVPELGEVLLPRLRVGEYVSYRIPATGVPSPTFSLVGNVPPNVPNGLTLDSGTGEITGTPTKAGESYHTVTATNSVGSDSQGVVFDVLPATSFPTLTFSGVTLPTTIVVKQNCYVDMELPAAIGGKPPVIYDLVGIPSTMQFNPVTRKLTGISGTLGDTPIYYSATDASSPEQSAVYASSIDLKTERVGQWSGLLLTADKANLIDGPSDMARQYNLTTGVREVANFADIVLGTGEWTGCVATSNRKIFVDNTGNRAVFYDLNNNEQTSEQIALGTGNWQDVALIGTNRLGFLDRNSGKVLIYSTARARLASADITFGFDAKFRSIAANANGSKLYVLIENLGALLVWDIGTGKFNYGDTITLVEGTTDWQAVARHSDGHLLVIHKNSVRALALTTAGVRDKTKDLILR